MHTLQAPSIEISINEDTPERVSSFFPPRPGVVVFVGEQDQAVLISAASNMRAFIDERLGINAEPSLRRVDLLPVTSKIHAYPSGIGLETNWLLARTAEQLSADLETELFERASVWFLCFLNDSMRWVARQSADLLSSGGRGEDLIIGPIPRKEDASALGEMLDDLYSLCRYPKELALAPRGTACAYKDMGRCPAACDGSEPLTAYRDRLLLAMSLLREGLEPAMAICRSRIDEASQAMEFEAAAEHKRVLDAIQRLPKERYRGARSISSMESLVVAPSVRRGWASIWHFGGKGLERICTINEHAPDTDLRLLIAQAQRGSGIGEISRRAMMDLGLVSREIHAKPGRGAGRKRLSRVFDLDQDLSMAELLKAITQAANPPKEDGDETSPYKSP